MGATGLVANRHAGPAPERALVLLQEALGARAAGIPAVETRIERMLV